MFERFTDRARRVLVLAQEEARLLEHNYIGTEHILLGLVREGDGVAAKALESLDISLEAVRAKVAETLGPAGPEATGSVPFTPRSKKVLELSLREALRLGHNYIGTEHILLGLVREGEGVAARVLVGMGADLTNVRQKVMELLVVQAPADEEPTKPGPPTTSSPAGVAGGTTVSGRATGQAVGPATGPAIRMAARGSPEGGPAPAAGWARGTPPCCSSCGAGLAVSARYHRLEVLPGEGETGKGPLTVAVVYCAQCGTVVGPPVGAAVDVPPASPSPPA